MAPSISVSTNQQDHYTAAKALSKHLDSLGVRHAYIGGFAWSLLGSERPTEINVLIEDQDIEALREKVAERDQRFTQANIKFYFITKNVDGSLAREEALHKSTSNVLVETLRAGTLGLPTAITITYEPGELGIHILHPTILILTKFKRWSINQTSTRPKTIKKTTTDERDIRHAVDWLWERSECVRFDEYAGKTKPELLAMVRQYHHKFHGDTEHIEHLRSIMSADWDDMLALPVREKSPGPPP